MGVGVVGSADFIQPRVGWGRVKTIAIKSQTGKGSLRVAGEYRWLQSQAGLWRHSKPGGGGICYLDKINNPS